MNRLILGALGLTALVLPASAGTITITVTTATGTCTGTTCQKVFTDTDAHLGQILTAYGPSCQQSNGGVACSTTALVTFILDDIANYIKTNTNNLQNGTALSGVVLPSQINPQ